MVNNHDSISDHTDNSGMSPKCEERKRKRQDTLSLELGNPVTAQPAQESDEGQDTALQVDDSEGEITVDGELKQHRANRAERRRDNWIPSYLDGHCCTCGEPRKFTTGRKRCRSCQHYSCDTCVVREDKNYTKDEREEASTDILSANNSHNALPSRTLPEMRSNAMSEATRSTAEALQIAREASIAWRNNLGSHDYPRNRDGLLYQILEPASINPTDEPMWYTVQYLDVYLPTRYSNLGEEFISSIDEQRNGQVHIQWKPILQRISPIMYLNKFLGIDIVYVLREIGAIAGGPMVLNYILPGTASRSSSWHFVIRNKTKDEVSDACKMLKAYGVRWQLPIDAMVNRILNGEIVALTLSHLEQFTKNVRRRNGSPHNIHILRRALRAFKTQDMAHGIVVAAKTVDGIGLRMVEGPRTVPAGNLIFGTLKDGRSITLHDVDGHFPDWETWKQLGARSTALCCSIQLTDTSAVLSHSFWSDSLDRKHARLPGEASQSYVFWNRTEMRWNMEEFSTTTVAQDFMSTREDAPMTVLETCLKYSLDVFDEDDSDDENVTTV